MQRIAALMCLLCGQDYPWPGTQGSITTTVSPEQAVKVDGAKDASWSEDSQPAQPKPTSSKSHSAQQRGQPSSKQLCDDATPNLVLSEDTAIGNGHRSIATSVSAKQPRSGNTGTKLTYLNMIFGPFFVEAFSGSGRMAAGVRERGLQAFEFDLTAQGGEGTSCTPVSYTS